MSVYSYLRVSSDKQDVQSQNQCITDFAGKNGWKIDEQIVDDGVSGSIDYHKRMLGNLLEKVKEKDIIIVSEISRLGRNLLMVMEILNFCMKAGATVYSVKDNYKLGDDIQSKVLAFAFGLSAEIERKMIQARTKEGLQLRVKAGILLGRPVGAKTSEEKKTCNSETELQQIKFQFELGVPISRIAKNLSTTKETIYKRLYEQGVHLAPHVQKKIEADNKRFLQIKENAKHAWKDTPLERVDLSDKDKRKWLEKIDSGKTIPEIADEFSNFTYDQIYDTIYCDAEMNRLYRSRGQKRIKGIKTKREFTPTGV
ncbi:recombinase family protein [Candidatus Avelusimicrobium fimicolum]|uniref:recombinase family protein n=1 Tax=Candidatus Avelusimicrobium fimicolum TaxID=3416216 RepID=UPI003D0BD465